MLKFNDFYKNDIDDRINNLKPIEVTFKHNKFLKKTYYEQASVILKNVLQKINENVSSHVEEIEDESILKVICKTHIDHINKLSCSGVHLPSEKVFDKVIPIKNKNITTQKEEEVLLICYGLQPASKVTKQYLTKYRQITIYIGIWLLKIPIQEKSIFSSLTILL